MDIDEKRMYCRRFICWERSDTQKRESEWRPPGKWTRSKWHGCRPERVRVAAMVACVLCKCMASSANNVNGWSCAHRISHRPHCCVRWWCACKDTRTMLILTSSTSRALIFRSGPLLPLHSLDARIEFQKLCLYLIRSRRLSFFLSFPSKDPKKRFLFFFAYKHTHTHLGLC